MEVSRPRNQIGLAVAFILIAAAYIAMQCWPAQIGCHQPSVVGWLNYLNLVFSIAIGPLAPIYMLVLFSPDGIRSLNQSNLSFFAFFIVLSAIPWLVYLKFKNALSLSVASIMWVAIGWLCSVGIFT